MRVGLFRRVNVVNRSFGEGAGKLRNSSTKRSSTRRRCRRASPMPRNVVRWFSSRPIQPARRRCTSTDCSCMTRKSHLCQKWRFRKNPSATALRPGMRISCLKTVRCWL